MGPHSNHSHKRSETCPESSKTGKTKADKASGKHARRLANRHADPIREGGGKQFKGK